MKRLLNTVYVTTEGAALRKDGENLVVTVEDAERARVPLHMLAAIVTFGAIYMSPAIVQACAAGGISLTLLDRAGRFQARVEGPIAGNVLLRRAQYRASEQPVEIVRGFVLGKIANQRTVLMRGLRDHGGGMEDAARDAIAGAVARLAHILRRANLASQGIDTLRGDEGEAAGL
jgi:CRISPR-associated protein Cas1